MTNDTSKLYTPRLLGLAANLYHFPFDEHADHIGEARSKTCGSVIRISARRSADGSIANIGMAVTACAIGQSSAAILAAGAKGKTAAEISQALGEIETWLSSADHPMPQWPGFDALETARAHPGRHGALVIPWIAINDALSSHSSAS